MFVSNINFVSLCESVMVELALLNEAEHTNLADIAKQATKFRTQQKQDPSSEVREHATKQLIILRSFLIDEINVDLPEEKKKKTDQEIDEDIYKFVALPGNRFDGLLHLVTKMLPKRAANSNLNYRQ
jgi:hypothetical protein